MEKKKVEEMREAGVERQGKTKKQSERELEGGLLREREGEREEERGEVMRPVTGFTPRLCGN